MNSTPEYRKECEVRFVAAMDSAKRQSFYEAVMKARGEAAARELAAAVKALLLERSGA